MKNTTGFSTTEILVIIMASIILAGILGGVIFLAQVHTSTVQGVVQYYCQLVLV